MMTNTARVMESPQIDESVLSELADAVGTEGVTTLIDLFVTDFAESVDNCLQAVENGDCETARSQAHQMKSSARYLGALELSDLCRTLEAEAREQNLKALHQDAASLRTIYQETAAELTSLRNRLN